MRERPSVWSSARLSFACVVLSATNAVPSASQGTLPPFPGPVRVSELARDTAGSVRGEVVATHALADGWACPTELTTYTRVGDEVREDTLTFAWDEAHPPVHLGSPPNPPDPAVPLCLFDANRRLLLVSYERDASEDALLAAARVPSRRFTAEELDWAWLAVRNAGFALPSKPKPGFDLDWFATQPGHRELAMRFGNGATWLDAHMGGPALTAEEIELAQLGLQLPGLESRALHVLLAHGVPVDPGAIRDPTARLCARLAKGDAHAQADCSSAAPRSWPGTTWRVTNARTGTRTLAWGGTWGSGSRPWSRPRRTARPRRCRTSAPVCERVSRTVRSHGSGSEERARSCSSSWAAMLCGFDRAISCARARSRHCAWLSRAFRGCWKSDRKRSTSGALSSSCSSCACAAASPRQSCRASSRSCAPRSRARRWSRTSCS